jgi:hypothetical protein
MEAAVNDTKPLMHRRLAAWAVAGPLGHLVAGVADWAVAIWRHLRSTD